MTHCIDVSTDFWVKFYLKNVAVSLPGWFGQRRNTFLTCKAMVVNFISYLNERSEEQNKILDEVNRSKHSERPVYSHNMIPFALELCYTSVHANKVTRKEMRPPSLSFVGNFTHGVCLCTKLVLCFINKLFFVFLIQIHPFFSMF